MRKSAAVLTFALLTSPVLAQPYPAPVGNCDAAVMYLEAARTAHTVAGTALTQARGEKSCSPAVTKAMDAKLAAATNISRRATSLLAACPGMDSAMEQGIRMVTFSKAAVADATKERQDLTAACPGP